MSAIRILFFADTHLGIDLPARPRIVRRRRGHDFFANYERVLETAVRERVDAVVHGGDLFYRSRIPAKLVQQAFLPLKRVADRGIPVFLVPGNHERSRIPYPLLSEHPEIHIFHRPQAFVRRMAGKRVAFAGFPYHRRGVRSAFGALLGQTGWEHTEADVNLICVHHCFEGATVGLAGYVFRGAPDVVRARDIPDACAAVLTGHVHRHQVLTMDLRGQPLPAPVFYPGSIERTSFAERTESKGYLVVEVGGGRSPGGAVTRWEFRPLPARPMVVMDITGDMSGSDFESVLRRAIDGAPPDAVLRLRIHGEVDEQGRRCLAAAHLRSLAPPTMNIDAVLVADRGWRARNTAQPAIDPR